jgi:hypothetical protein
VADSLVEVATGLELELDVFEAATAVVFVEVGVTLVLDIETLVLDTGFFDVVRVVALGVAAAFVTVGTLEWVDVGLIEALVEVGLVVVEMALVVEEAFELVEVATVGAGAATVPPNPTIGLVPGNASKTPRTSSLIAESMLQVVPESLIPPRSPGHLSIPASPASQLSMICWRTSTSQPLI